ncbi:MAG TPA: c-type cytochrome, partial [Niabella sp.]
SKNVPVSLGSRLKGQGFIDFKAPGRAADPNKGSSVYVNRCASCHGPDGAGMKGTDGNREGGYIYPPLWGDDSYNDGAGMARLLTAARFIKANMPFGVTHDAPLLSDDEAYDVAAFINSHGRPVKANKELDYPDLSKKPKDCPYPPYQDAVAQEQHKLGPFNFGSKSGK